MSDKMRSEFEAWAKSLPFANMERHLDGYLNQSINSFWSVWQASRAALVVELPHLSGNLKSSYSAFDNGFECGFNDAIDEVKSKLVINGVDYK